MFLQSKVELFQLSESLEQALEHKHSSEFLSQLDVPAAQQLQAGCGQRSYKKGETIYYQDDEANYLYIILKGYAKLGSLTSDSSEFTYAIIGPGEPFGELGVYQKSFYADTAVALSPLEVFRIHRNTFFQLSINNLSACDALSRLVANRYRSYIRATRCVSMKNMSARLANTLLRIAEQIGKTVDMNGTEIECIGSFVTQTDIGYMARCSRSNVNRKLKCWERAGIVEIHDRSILLHDRKFLEQASSEGELEGSVAKF
ncbi:cyclic nucleotide-binding domain protein [Rhodobacteraceae bacterium KLH11]|nr:cyclic nucleotide-binding domain protein [Rhodobacteraceae bacterium KLH11]